MTAIPTSPVKRSKPARTVSNGEANRLFPEDRSVHDWYRFVLSFPPHLVRDYLERFRLGASDVVLDPFCGTGTTLVECKRLGLPSLGMEVLPMPRFAARVKTDWQPDSEGLLDHAKHVAGTATRRLEEDGIEDAALLPLRASQKKVLRSLPDELRSLLLKDSISALPLHKALVLLESIRDTSPTPYTDPELLALARVAVLSASNLRFGPEVGVGLIKPDAAVIGPWLAAVRQMAEDLSTVRDRRNTPSEVHSVDSRSISDSLPAHSISAVITSPPYPNEKDYTRTTRLESVLLGFVRGKEELQSIKKQLVRSNTRCVYKDDDDDQWVRDRPEIQRIAWAIEKRRVELGKTSGFERQYARVTLLYFGGMARHLAGLRRVLKPGAHLAYVVGDQASYLQVMIHTGRILGDIAISLGYELQSIDLFRTRLATATRKQLREEVVVLRWPGESDRGGRKR